MHASLPAPAGKLLTGIVALSLAACGSLIPANNQTTDTAKLESGNYKLDPEHSTILFKVNHLGFSTYVGRFNTLAGSLRFDPEVPAESQLAVTVETASVDTPSAELDGILQERDWFDTGRFPTARFESTGIAVTGNDTGTVTGDLTLRGVTVPVTRITHSVRTALEACCTAGSVPSPKTTCVSP